MELIKIIKKLESTEIEFKDKINLYQKEEHYQMQSL